MCPSTKILYVEGAGRAVERVNIQEDILRRCLPRPQRRITPEGYQLHIGPSQ